MMNLDYLMEIQDYFKFIIKIEQNSTKYPTQIYVNRIKNRITFKIKEGYILELSKPETLKLLGSTEKNISKDKNCILEIIEIVLFQCNVANNGYLINHLEN